MTKQRGGIKDTLTGDANAKRLIREGLTLEQSRYYDSAIVKYKRALQSVISGFLKTKIESRIRFCERAIIRGESVESV